MLRKFLISAAAAIGFTAASFGGAQAVILGEASVTLFDGLYTNQNGVQSLGASFVYANDLPDSNTLARYEASAFLTVEGQELFNESLDLGVTTLEDLIPPEVIEFGLLALDLLLNNPTGTIFIDETDPDINFDYTFALFPGSDFTAGAGFFQLISNQDYSNELAGLNITVSEANFTAGASLTAFAVPLPAALPLMGSGLLLVGFMVRRRNSA